MIDPDSNTGAGYGLAPIGHTVTVEGAVESEFPLCPILSIRRATA